ncbi:MAG: hypothetical protein JXA20_04165, partial [Spirochaetes bacterium]|nr:hypothetical protein [Spirochaetota bacterium]
DEPGTVRWLIERLSKRSISGTCGVIIDGIEHITPAGQNALLKTIEEPQEGTAIILISANRSQVLPTILSRSTEIPFQPLSERQVGEVLRGLSSGAEGAEDAIGANSVDLAAAISGGSVERALVLGDAAFMESLMGLCAAISATARTGAPFDRDLSQYQKRPGYEALLDMLVHIYRLMLRGTLQGSALPEALAPAVMEDRDTIVKIIKIFLALKGGLANNLNMRMHLKGMLYGIGGMETMGMPDLSA